MERVGRTISMTRVFEDRVEAGRALARSLFAYRGATDAIVLALPRGGVPVGFEVAQALGLPLDVLVVRKLGLPGQPELAMGAIATGGALVLNEDVLRFADGREAALEQVRRREQVELERRERQYRGARPPLQMAGRTGILVDDGLATGATMEVAVRALRGLGATRIVVAVPVASQEARDRIAAVADEVVCLEAPMFFSAVGQWYRDFGQTSDAEVSELLARPDAFGRRHAGSVRENVANPPWRLQGGFTTVSRTDPACRRPNCSRIFCYARSGATARGATHMSELGPEVLRIDDLSGREEALDLDPARLVEGSPSPEQHVRNLYTDDTGRFFGGIWRSGKGAWHVSYTENELCVLTEGRVRISDDHGRFWTFGPGDCFVMPAGFRGVWEVLEPARKFYAIYEPPPAG